MRYDAVVTALINSNCQRSKIFDSTDNVDVYGIYMMLYSEEQSTSYEGRTIKCELNSDIKEFTNCNNDTNKRIKSTNTKYSHWVHTVLYANNIKTNFREYTFANLNDEFKNIMCSSFNGLCRPI